MPDTRIKLSVIIITKNEDDRIGNCLKAVEGLADEVVVVDSGSTDKTIDIARAMGAKVVHNDWVGYGPQKRFSEDCATNDWVLNLDADEVVTPELKAEILTLLSGQPAINAYRMKIRNVYPGQSKPRLWADYNHYVRLYNRKVVRFRESLVHDTVDTRDEKVGELKAPVIHFSARSFEHIRKKLDAYTGLQAKALKKPLWVIGLRLPFEYPLVFIRYFIFRRHFTGGWQGLFSAHLAAEARVNRLIKLAKAKHVGAPPAA
jgi:glycosyltransferase involved in cell wall biosynthesis